MAEYAGYVAPTPIDFGAISSGMLSNRLAIEKLKKSEKSDALKLLQKQQAADEKARIQARKEEAEKEKGLREDLKEIKTPTPVVNRSFTDFVQKLANSAREKVVELNAKKNKGELTPSQYIMAVNNITSGVNQYVDISKIYGDNLKVLTDSISKREQSGIGVFKIGKYANSGQYQNKIVKPAPDDSGILEYYTIDANGNEVKDQTIDNLEVLKTLDLYSDRAVDYNALFKAADESIGTYKKEVGATTVDSKLLRKGIDELVAKKANEIIPLDEDKARLLNSKLGYGIYSDEQEKQEALQQMYPIAADREKAIKDGSADKKLIKYKLSNKGVWTPDLTDDQRTTAVEYAKSDIKGRFEYSELKDEPIIIKTPENKPPTEAKAGRQYRLETAIAAQKDLIQNGKNARVVETVENYYNSLYPTYGVKTEVVGTGPNRVLKVFKITDDEGTVSANPVKVFKNIRDIFSIYTPNDRKGIEDAEFKQAVEESGGRYGNLQ